MKQQPHNNQYILWVLLFLISAAWWTYHLRSRHQQQTLPPEPHAQAIQQNNIPDALPEPHSPSPPHTPHITTPPLRKMIPSPTANSLTTTTDFKYVIDDDVAVTMGDVALGVPPPQMPTYGRIPPFKMWDSTDIPYYIQPNLQRPERVQQALELFRGTPLRFVPLNDQEDAIVFVDAKGVCKSYVGRVGGKQPIWVGPQCEAHEIVHEILHALGFIHEQNRLDRDGFIKVFAENIEAGSEQNFARLPDEFMKLTGLSEFDFQSVMIYPKDMFAKKGTVILEPKDSNKEITPSYGLSDKDRLRIEKAFAGK